VRNRLTVSQYRLLKSDFIIIIFYTPGSKGSRGLKTKVKNVAGMAVGSGNQSMLNESCKSTELKRWIVTEMRWNKH